MKYFTALLLMCSSTLFAETALRDDGKQVELLPDGSWRYISEDVLATSASGLRVRLLDDGTWEPLEKKAERPSSAGATRITSFQDKASLQSIEIQKMKVSRANSKTTVFEHNMLAKISFSETVSDAALAAKNFSLTDSKGKAYPILNISKGGSGDVFVRAEGAPDRWSRTKYLSVTVSEQVLDTLAPITLSVDFRDVKTRVLTEFSDE